MSIAPKISILLPNLNNRRYLDERIDCILNQTYTDWELVIVDNYSDDGAWEFFKKIAISDSRIRIFQAPRNGMYANWNNCIRLARGEYIYIATSDDTMTHDCLECLVAALDEYPQCDIAHCCLKIIDENGNPWPSQWDQWNKVLFYGDLIQRMHIRKAPYDGYVHAGWSTVYTSVTQLLIRRSLFNKIGFFRNDLGSVADFEWELRAALVSDVIHIPRYLATWRRHSAQATQSQYLKTADFSRKLIGMVESAFKEIQYLNKNLRKNDLLALQHIYKRQLVSRYLKESSSTAKTILLIFNNMKNYPYETFELIVNKISMNKKCKIDIDNYINAIIKGRNLENNIVII
jgi:glycosyltransferase involved in cell wall biosynthesis